ncbi:MAG: hypothetical protein WCP11_01770 [Candidatus Saccharibacteria bacterium]
MSIIVPSIMATTPDQLKASVEKFQPLVTHIHLDVSDGQFASTTLLAPEQLWWPRGWMADIHAMVKNPIDYVDRLIALKPDLIIFHAETGVDLLPIFDRIKHAGIRAGIALLKPTVPSDVAGFINAADHVLVFSGDLGHYGGTASLMQLEKIRLIRAINPKVEIGWDGGVAIDNVFTLTQGGVNILNAGGVLDKAINVSGVYAELTKEITKQGVI